MHTTTTRGFFFATKFEAYARTRFPNRSTKYPRPGAIGEATQPRQAAGQPAQAAAAVRGAPAGRVHVRRTRAGAAVDRVAAEASDAE